MITKIQVGVVYGGRNGKTVRRVLSINTTAFPHQSDPSAVQYQVLKSPIKQGKANGIGYIGVCTMDRFLQWAYTIEDPDTAT